MRHTHLLLSTLGLSVMALTGCAQEIMEPGDLHFAEEHGDKPSTVSFAHARESRDSCGEVDYFGECTGEVLTWCDRGTLRTVDCASREGFACDYVSGRIGFDCIPEIVVPDAPPAEPPLPEDPRDEDPRPDEPPVDEPPRDPADIDPPAPATSCGNTLASDAARATNDQRRRAGLGSLACDIHLVRAAQGHAEDMCAQRYFSHQSLDGRSFTDRIDAAGARYTRAGENIAAYQRTGDQVVTAWMNSAGHRANILNGTFNRIGMGYAACDGRPLWVQVFTQGEAIAPPEPTEDPTPEEPPSGEIDPPDPIDPAPAGACGNAMESEQMELTNQERRRAGLRPLSCDRHLALSARLHAEDMCRMNYFSHQSLDGRSFSDRALAAGTTVRPGGENIALGQRNATEATASWMRSPGHRANILNERFAHIGIGQVDCAGRNYWVQVFGF